MQIRWQFDNDKPIYLQIVELIKRSIVSGELKSGDRIESVREIATNAKVNPNTVQRALGELERIGLVYTERTNGRFITNDNKLIEEMKSELAKKEVCTFLNNMQKLGFDRAAILKQIENYEEEV